MKVVWICHFTNAEIQSVLPLWEKRNEFSPWIPNFLKSFENRKDIELHVIAPHEYLKKTTILTLRNIHYSFIPFGIPVWHRHWPGLFRFDVFSNYYFIRKKIKRIVQEINPDLINLMGAENAYYSSAILKLKNECPVLITIQGFVSQLKSEYNYKGEFSYRINLEEKILRTFKYFSGEQDSSVYISKYNPDHVFFRLYFPVNEALISSITTNTGKNYDCIYFGKLTRTKGAEDFIRVIAEIKSKKTDVKACVVGGGNADPYKTLAKELSCEKNIEFVGFVKSQRELFEYVKSSKVFLAPPYFERLSMTIREAMLLKVPVVAYATGGIPYINESNENIFLVKTGDYLGIANRTILLLEDESLRINLAEKAYQYAIKEFSLKVNAERVLVAYQTILKENKNKLKNEL